MGELKILPSGKSVTLRASQNVSERLRRPIAKALRVVRQEIQDMVQQGGDLQERLKELAEGSEEWEQASEERQRLMMEIARQATDEEIDAYNDANDYAAVALVERWDYEDPVTIDSIIDLPHADYSALRELVAPLTSALFVDASPNPEKGSPFVSSNGSVTSSEAALPTTSLTAGATIDSSG